MNEMDNNINEAMKRIQRHKDELEKRIAKRKRRRIRNLVIFAVLGGIFLFFAIHAVVDYRSGVNVAKEKALKSVGITDVRLINGSTSECIEDGEMAYNIEGYNEKNEAESVDVCAPSSLLAKMLYAPVG